MSQANTAGDPRARLREIAEALVLAHRALCTHPDEQPFSARCPSCDQIEEVRDMIRCAADTIFEASALCAHFQAELRALVGGGRGRASEPLGASYG